MVLIYLSGFFSSMETAFVSISSLKVKQLIANKTKNADLLNQIKKDQHRLIITILICNNLVNIGASALATYLTIKLLNDAYIGATTGILTLIILIFGEITPKTKAALRSEQIALKNASKMKLLMLIFTPIIKILDVTTGLILKLSGITSTKRKEEAISEDTLKQIVQISEKEGSINSDEKEMIHNIFEFDDTLVKNIMTPRTDVYGIDLNDDVHKNIASIIESGFSRVPVYSKTVDKTLGILYVKDLLKIMNNNKSITKTDLKAILRPAFFVPENKKINSLFNQLKNKKTYIAIVVDEYGGVAGLVTMEDLIEEIVGDIYDEFDDEEFKFKRLSKKEVLVDGGLSVDELNDELQLSLEESDDYDTVSGLILDKIERIPNKDEIFDFGAFKIKIEKVKDHKIELVKIILN
ncbi:HlyC/CorC family transporter [Candidatus Woesearchaeota archaeon]|nr:HlyC/CorC family transporter [Candidatus Woesearchaeota archaeon]